MLWEALALFAVLYFIVKYVTSNFMKTPNLAEKPVLITGCDTDFGHSLAIKLVNEGMQVFAGCLTEDGENRLCKAVELAKGKLWTFHLDVTNQETVDKAVAYVGRQLGPNQGLWGLVNNAAILGDSAPDDWLDVESYQKAMEVNIFGVIRVTHAFKSMIKAGRGRVVMITSVFGRLALPTLGPYNVSKFAAEAYSDVLRVEMQPFGVSVHILEPGLFITNITSPKVVCDNWLKLWQRQPEEIKNEYDRSYLEKCVEVLRRSLTNYTNKDTSLVVNAYYHALTSRWPKSRYIIGLDAWLYYIPLSLLPTFLSDWILELSMQYEKAPRPKPAQHS